MDSASNLDAGNKVFMQSYSDLIPCKIHLECVDSYSVRIVWDILAGFCQSPTINFTENGMRVTECKANQKIEMSFTIEDTWLTDYSYELMDTDENLIDVYSFKVNAKDFLAALRGVDGKRSSLFFDVDIKADGTNGGIYVRMNDMPGFRFVKSFGFRDSMTIPSRIYEMHYSKRKPNTKVKTSAFSNLVNSAKTCGCTAIDFILCSDARIFCKCRINAEVANACYLQSNLVEHTGENPDGIHTISVNRKDIDWASKLSRLSPDSTTRFFMDADTPMVFQTLVGTHGHGEYTIEHDENV